MKKYKTSGQVSFGAIILMLLVAILGGAAAGVALWAVEYFTQFYLIILFPAVAGVIVGGLLTLVVRGMKVQNVPVIILVGIIGGAVLYSTYQFATYFVTFREGERQYAASLGEELSDAELDEILNAGLTADYGQPGFLGYLQYAADQGITLTRSFGSSSSSSGTPIQGTGWWLFSGFEMLIAIFVAATTPLRDARFPLDSGGNRYPQPTLTAFADASQPRQVFGAIKDGNWRQIGALFNTDQAQPYPRIELYTACAQDPNADVYAEFHHILKTRFGQRRGQAARVEKGMIAPADFALFQQALAQPRTPNVVR